MAIVESYVAREPDRFRLVRTTSGPSGTPTAINAGIRAMRGQYFSWLSSDDAAAPQKLERLLAAFKAEPDLGLVHSAYRLIDSAGQPMGLTEPLEYPGIESFFQLLEGNNINGSTVLIPKTLLDEIGPLLETDEDCHELWLVSEYLLWLEIAIRRKIHVLAEPLHDWRIHAVNGDYNRSQLGPNLVRAAKRKFLVRYALSAVVSLLADRSNQPRAKIYERIAGILSDDPSPEDFTLFGDSFQTESSEVIAGVRRATQSTQKTRMAAYVVEYKLETGRPIPARLTRALTMEGARKKRLALGALNHAKEAFRQKNYSECIQRLQAVLSVPALPAETELSARFYLARSLEKAGETEKAVEELKRVLELEPGHGKAREDYERIRGARSMTARQP